MKIVKCLVLFSLIISFTMSYAQDPSIEWEGNYGGTLDDRASFLNCLSDSGYILSGFSHSSDGDLSLNHGGADYWICKINSAGSIEWEKNYGGSGADYGGSIVELNDGYLITGVSNSIDGDIIDNIGLGDGCIIRTDLFGDILWQKNYGGSNTESINSVIQLNDGSFITAGYTYSNNGDCEGNHGDADFWIMKITNEGEIVWSKCFGGSGYETAMDASILASGEIVICGISDSEDGDLEFNFGSNDFWVIKIDNDGELIWEKNYGGTNSDEAYSILERSDGKLLCVGLTYSNDFNVSGLHGELYSDFWVILLDVDNSLLWQKCYGGSLSEQAHSVVIVNDNEFVISGVSSTDDNGDVNGHHGEAGYGDMWVVSIDTLGNIKWETSLGGSLTDYSFSITQSLDSGLVVGGYSLSMDGDVGGHYGPETYADYWVVKLSSPCMYSLYYADDDGDLFGNPDVSIYSCFDTLGYVSNDLDCDDENSEINPAMADLCNEYDDNCNGSIDEDAIFLLWYEDSDGDSFGNVSNDSLSCHELAGFCFDTTDCDDSSITVYPGALEICNYLDDDCDGIADDDLTYILQYQDADEDNYGNLSVDSLSCIDIPGFVPDSNDCNDDNPEIHPGAIELLNGLDDDCDGQNDEGLAIIENYTSKIIVFPNPTAGEVTISLSGNQSTEIIIRTIDGKLIRNISNVLSEQYQLDLTTEAPGVYILLLECADKVCMFKLVKN